MKYNYLGQHNVLIQLYYVYLILYINFYEFVMLYVQKYYEHQRNLVQFYPMQDRLKVVHAVLLNIFSHK